MCFTLPMLHSYVQRVSDGMDRELSLCRNSAKDIWSEVSHLKNIPIAANRTARQAGYDSGVSGGGASAGGSCSDCCSGGQAGPPGVGFSDEI